MADTSVFAQVLRMPVNPVEFVRATLAVLSRGRNNPRVILISFAALGGQDTEVLDCR